MVGTKTKGSIIWNTLQFFCVLKPLNKKKCLYFTFMLMPLGKSLNLSVLLPAMDKLLGKLDSKPWKSNQSRNCNPPRNWHHACNGEVE